MPPPNRFDLNLLAVFDAIYTYGGVSEAARQLSLSQPAISHSLARMREAFGDRLFVRHGNGLVPTTAARSIIQPIRDALRSIDVALANASAFDPRTSDRSFHLGLRPASEIPAFAGLVARLLGEAPAIRVSSLYFARGALSKALATGTVDLALDVYRPPSPGVRSTAFDPGTLVVVARTGHPAIGEALDLDRYLSLDHVFVSPRAGGSGLEDAALAGIGHHRNVKVRCQSALTAWQIVGTSDLICTLPQSYASALTAVEKHRLFPLPFPMTPNALHLYWHESSEMDGGASWLRERTLSHVAVLLADGHRRD